MDVGRWYKAGLDHAAHIQVADSLGVLAVGFVALLRLCVFGVGQSDTAGLFKDIEYGNPDWHIPDILLRHMSFLHRCHLPDKAPNMDRFAL